MDLSSDKRLSLVDDSADISVMSSINTLRLSVSTETESSTVKLSKRRIVVQEAKFEYKSEIQVQKDTEEKQRTIDHIFETRKLAEKVPYLSDLITFNNYCSMKFC